MNQPGIDQDVAGVRPIIGGLAAGRPVRHVGCDRPVLAPRAIYVPSSSTGTYVICVDLHGQEYLVRLSVCPEPAPQMSGMYLFRLP